MAFKTKAQLTEALVAEAVGAGKKAHLESVDFSDPNRPLTCLEVDFPILPINQIAQIEGNAGKPIYQMSKWWARRRSSVFRSMLIAAATKAPDDSSEAAKLVWENYYANHQDNQAFRKLKVADIFMGGGTTLVEGTRLGMQMTGNDLNPVAWLVVKNELADVDIDEVNKLFDHIEREVKPQIMPFYACEGPNGEKGKWIQRSTGKVMGEDFAPLSLTPEERKDYNYEGPEVIYTFWAKHGPCTASGCGHRTPLMTSPVVAVKSLSVKSWEGIECKYCAKIFDIERHEVRMAPDVPLVVSDSEAPYTIMDNAGNYQCPHCQHQYHDEAAAQKGESLSLPKRMSKNKKIDLTLLVHPAWMKGASGSDAKGRLGGSANSSLFETTRWNETRAQNLKCVEVRGNLPSTVTLPDGTVFNTSEGNISKKSTFVCQQETCGREQNVLDAVSASADTGPLSALVLQCFSSIRKSYGKPYSGRYFKVVESKDVERLNAASTEWNLRKNSDLLGYWPTEELSYGWKTHGWSIPDHGFTHYWKFFNDRQLLVHSLIMKAIEESHGFSDSTKNIALGALQQYLRNQNLFCFWNIQADKMEPMFTSNNYHSKSMPIENSVFSTLGRGNWASCVATTIDALNWKNRPWDLVSNEVLKDLPQLKGFLSGKSEKAYPDDIVLKADNIYCGSSTDLASVKSGSLDLVITDPPFGNLVQYAELADFFYVWLKKPLNKRYPDVYATEYTPKTLEVVTNPARNKSDPDLFYKRLLTECWREAKRMLKDGGLLAFTFHHSEDQPWIDVLESLFDAGFYLEATYPIRSDETKGDKAQFGSQKIEYDIIHVCRKRTEAPSKISWARLRRKILADVKQLQSLLEHHQAGGLPIADTQVIKRGKALEYFSRHYGQVYLEEGREFTVNEALVGINQILDDQSESESGGTPVVCEPNTRQFLRIFSRQASIDRDQMQKFLRGSGIAPSMFVAWGWAIETTRPKAFHWRSPLEFAQERMINKRNLSRDFDQAMLLVGACYPESGINTKKILNENFKPHPALGHLLDWLVHNGADATMRTATVTARQLYSRWEAEHQSVVQQQISLFDMEGEV